MKKFLAIIALVAIYATAISTAEAKTSIIDNSKTTIVADADDSNAQPEGEKEEGKKKKTVKKASSCCSQKAAVKTSCSQAQKKSCAASKVSCSETKKEDKK